MTYEQDVDAISVGDILKRLWRSRGLVVALPLLGLLLGLSIAAWNAYMSRPPITYYISLNNIENSSYPNGTAFQPGDIVSRPVLDELRKRLKISDKVDLARNVIVTLDSPMAAGIEKVYRDRLSARNLAQADIDALNTAFTKQLEATVGKTVRIDVDYEEMGLTKSEGVEVALALPASWTEVYTKQFRTLLSPGLAASIPNMSVENFQNAVGVLEVNGNIDEIRRGLDAIISDNRLNSVQDERGATAEDVQQRLNLYSDIYSTPIFASYVGENSTMSQIYLRDQQLRINQLQEQIVGLDESISKLQASQSSRPPIESGQTLSPNAVGQNPNVQLDSGALTQIVGLAEKASNGEFLKELLTKRQEANLAISNIKRRLELAKPTGIQMAVDQNFVKQSFEGYNQLAESYNQLLTAARERAEDRSGKLYQPLTAPAAEGTLPSMRTLALIAAMAFLGLFVASVYAIFRTPGPLSRKTAQA